jgi:NADH-quinone oxidoreductase subunit G
VLEFLLINHPVDCPVCDQAGECSLQDYYMKHGLYQSRFSFQKVKREKAQELGPHVLLDQERCVLCTRCVRFTSDVTKTGELAVEQRGFHAQITLFPGRTLDNPYSGNVVDVCPVGALLSKDFRFQSRVWFLKESKSICPGCSRGCNIRIDSRAQQIYRILPRENLDVNKVWLCDDGRFNFGFVGAPDRIVSPLARSEGKLNDVTWPIAMAALADRLRAMAEAGSTVAVLGSAQSPCETSWLAKRLAADFLRGGPTEFGRSVRGTTGSDRSDDFLEEPDKNPNTRGAAEVGLGQGSDEALEGLRQKIASGSVRGLILIDFDPITELPGQAWEEALRGLELLAVLKSNTSPACAAAHVVLPLTSFAEQDGTFVNSDGRVQRFAAAFGPVHTSRPGWQALRDLGKTLGLGWSYASAEEVFGGLAREVASFSAMTYKNLGDLGQPLGGGSSASDSTGSETVPVGAGNGNGAAAPVRAFGWRQWSWERKRPWE